MYLKYFEMSFVILAVIFALQLFLLMLNITRFLKPLGASDFVSSVAIVTMLYIVNALVLVLILPQNLAKFIMLLIAISPFLTGKAAEYKTRGLFTAIQLFVIICSIIYIVSFNKIGV